MTDSDIASYEQRFRRAGLPLFVEGYAAATDVFTRAAPLLALVFVGETLGAVDLDWHWYVNLAAIAGGLAFLLGAYAIANVVRGRHAAALPASVDAAEMVFFVVVPGLLPIIFGGQVTSGVVTMAVNAFLLLFIYVLSYGLPAILRGAFQRLTAELALSLATLARAVPLLLLFAAVLFINTEMWQVFSSVPAPFLGALAVLVIAFGLLFLVAQLPSEVRALEDAASDGHPLSRRQRINVGMIMLVSHALQVAVVTAAVGGAFIVFGALAIGPEIYDSWLGHAGDVIVTLHVFGEDARITAELLRVAGGVAGLSGLYYAIAVLTDATYRDQFLDRLSREMTEVFAERARYLEARASMSSSSSGQT